MSATLLAVQASLPLSPAAPAAGAGATVPPGLPARNRYRRLWLCLEFPYLPLEVFMSAGDGQPAAVLESGQGGHCVRLANAVAAARGVRAGLPLNAALALCPDLALKERDVPAEIAAVDRLAAWAGQFTSLVSVEPPRALLLEIQGSLRLFGGLEGLGATLDSGLATLGFRPRRAVAPTPRAALWLARGADGVVVTEAGALNARLGRLSLVHTGWSARTLQALGEMGVERVGECLRLPRDGFARRLGPQHLADLDRALGRLPEPRTGFCAPETYRGRLELPAETLDSERLCRGMARLLAELAGFLRARGGGVQQPVCGFVHAAGPPTLITLELSRPTESAALLEELLAERLDRCRLPAPVLELTLASGPVVAAEVTQPGLHETDEEMGDETPPSVPGGDRRLVDRLRARLGDGSVRSVGLLDDHRPEKAWRFQDVAGPPPTRCRRQADARPPDPAGARDRFDRPLWILECPRLLPLHEGRPWFEGHLRLLAGPERIETGWWDGADVSRDYFVAASPAGMQLWVYRERRGARRWFLHGVFG